MEETKGTISFIGIGVGALALLLALIHFWAGPFAPQPSLEQTVAEKAVAIRYATVAVLKNEKGATPRGKTTMDTDRVIQIATAVFGGMAIILGVLAYTQSTGGLPDPWICPERTNADRRRRGGIGRRRHSFSVRGIGHRRNHCGNSYCGRAVTTGFRLKASRRTR